MKKTSASIPVFLLAVILSLGVGCARKPDDARISSDVQSKFSQDSGLSSKQLAVQSSSGVVTLSGSVDNEAQRDAAARQAASVPGVKEVVNNLQVASVRTSLPRLLLPGPRKHSSTGGESREAEAQQEIKALSPRDDAAAKDQSNASPRPPKIPSLRSHKDSHRPRRDPCCCRGSMPPPPPAKESDN